ncbi:MAG TPA: hypothetical protein VMA37_01810 [Acetobacteraceae bacterium]|nr:hypothetical protein [Acetobacteraceae bacterium]
MITLASGIGLWAATGIAYAQQETVRQACASDYHAYCSGVQPGGGRIKACFQQNFSKLSQGCQQALLAMAKTQQQP